MRTVVLGVVLMLVAISPKVFGGEITLIEPAGLGRTGMLGRIEPIFVDSCFYRQIHPINTDSATSDAFQEFVYEIKSENGIDWSSLRLSIVSHGGIIAYPETSIPPYGWWDAYVPPTSPFAVDLPEASKMLFELEIDTLSDSCWILTVTPGRRIGNAKFVCAPECTIDAIGGPGPPVYIGPLCIVAGDTLSPGFGQLFDLNLETDITSVSVRDTLSGPPWPPITLTKAIGFDFNGPVASDPLPPDRATVMTEAPTIQIVILDTFSYDICPYPGITPPVLPHPCTCTDSACTTETGELMTYPYCKIWSLNRARIDTTSIRLSVNGREYTISSPGMHWLHDSLLVLNTEEAGLTFERGETVRVCLEEATDRTSQGYGPNHLGRYRDWTHPDTPIPFCWEFYIAGTGIEEAAATPEGFGIKSIKPNPFNSRTEIKFELAKEAEVSITVYNVQGQKVESLIKEKTLAPGHHSVVWNADGRTPTGIYFIKLSAGAFEDVKKVILLK